MSQPVRTCGTCTLCCKLFPVPELEKPSGRWCRHIVQARGCGIHATRPDVCRAFFCQWIENVELGPEWKPEVCKFVLSIYPGSNSLVVTVDPAQPRSFGREPYLGTLRRWAAAALQQGDQVLVFVGDRASAILPDREVDLGRIMPGDRIVTLKGPAGYDVVVRPPTLTLPAAPTGARPGWASDVTGTDKSVPGRGGRGPTAGVGDGV